jgi:hypothetical protein
VTPPHKPDYLSEDTIDKNAEKDIKTDSPEVVRFIVTNVTCLIECINT